MSCKERRFSTADQQKRRSGERRSLFLQARYYAVVDLGNR
jgi:hypothetical protein